MTFRTTEDLAKLLNMPASTVAELRQREGWPHLRFGRSIRFTDEQVAEIVATHTVTGEPAAPPPPFPGQRQHRSRSPRR